MKSYSFVPISARDYPTVKILDHPYIWGGVRFCVNLSEKPYSPELVEALAEHRIEWIHCPLSEEDGTSWWSAYSIALPKMLEAFWMGKKTVIHCDFGSNRSRTLIEAFHFLLTGTEYADEYKGEYNHLSFNCKRGHLPEMRETERLIRLIQIDYEQSLQG